MFLAPNLMVERSFLWFRFKKDSFKIHFEPQRLDYCDNKIHLGFGFFSDKAFTNWNVRTGASIFRDKENYKSELSHRLVISPENILLYNRASFCQNKFMAGGYNVYDMNKRALVKNSLIFGYC